MGALNYNRSRLKIVYPFNGFDKSKSEVKSVPNEQLFISDQIEIEEAPFIIGNMNAFAHSATFSEVLSKVPSVFAIDTTAVESTIPKLGNLYIGSPLTSSVVISQSLDNFGTPTGPKLTGSFGYFAIVVV